ncbi:MAG: DNA translocase FtsK 4TM domain-containing protein, partial [Pseudomonadota bacterium]
MSKERSSSAKRKPKPKTAKKRSSPVKQPHLSDPYETVSFWAPRLREGAVLVTAFLTFYFVLAFLSYHSTDPGFSDSGVGDKVNNFMGVSGAYLSDGLFSLIGYVAYILPLWAGFITWKLFKKRNHIPRFEWSEVASRVVGLLLFLLGAAAFLSLRNGQGGLPFGAGGLLGLKVSQEALMVFGLAGARVGLIAVSMFGLTILTDISWLQVVDTIGEYSVKLFDKLKGKLVKTGRQFKEQKQHLEVQRQRQETVQTKRVKIESREPPTIKRPDKKAIKQSTRIEKEKQVSLFETFGDTGELPPLSLLTQADPDNPKKGYSE